MPIEIIVPRLGWSMEEGAFVAWLKQDGELVQAGDLLFSIEGDKAIQEIESIDSGVLRIAPHAPQPGGTVRVGDVLGHLVLPGEIATPTTATAPALAATAVATSATSFAANPWLPAVPSILPTLVDTHPAAPGIPAGSRLSISPRALRVAAELGVDWTTLTGSGRNGRIRERDIRAAAGESNRSESSGTLAASRAVPLAACVKSANPSILVTGGCGFIGTWVLRELLNRGLPVVVLDTGDRPARWTRILGKGSQEVPLVQGSLLDRELLARVFAEHNVTRVIHLAALLTPACQTSPWEGCQVNVLGSVALFEQARARASTRPLEGFSYASSVAVFGDEPDHASGAVDPKSHPLTFYGAFKQSVELIAAQYWNHFQIASLGIRPQVAYGPERDVGLTAGPSLATRAAALGEGYCIRYTGRVGYDYVEDVARAFVRGALETPTGSAIVDLPGEMADMDEVLAAIAATAPDVASKLSAEGPPIPAHAPPNPHWISRLYPDWQTTPLNEGIRRTADFYRARAELLGSGQQGSQS
jgi:nucleoside-diphosphate-sugar epimerase